jgi:dCTP deaminase
MFLSDLDILREIKAERIICHPFVRKNLSVASIDLRLGTRFIETLPDYLSPRIRCENCHQADPHVCYKIDDNGRVSRQAHRLIDQPKEVDKGGFITVIPGGFIKGQTLEFVGSNAKHILVQLTDKSTFARDGLAICFNAGFGDNNALNFTLEITNNGHLPIVLTPGQHIAQARFSYTKTGCSRFYAGKYVGSTVVEAAV